MDHPPDGVPALVAIVSPLDRDEEPFGWSDPRRNEVPPEITSTVLGLLDAEGVTGAHATEHSIIVPLDGQAPGLPGPAAAGEHLYVLWGVHRPEWSWGTAHPNAPAGGHLALLLAPPDRPGLIADQIIRVLATGRTLP
ncbi:hypothetical protein GCM10010387_16200 [Streptomyces inusitatus]|uniref:Uncharacterized protein n=1 Tax=Streptomyces inusitatus TaxID=68221 RepID=A0A918UP23_9ACTN|nr:hypothetical protein [Streptomyces inusitatus]GGZ23738.1 hypothetical protein GCM10010387_16200 [Streptomyces inusitatus]